MKAIGKQKFDALSDNILVGIGCIAIVAWLSVIGFCIWVIVKVMQHFGVI